LKEKKREKRKRNEKKEGKEHSPRSTICATVDRSIDSNSSEGISKSDKIKE
jgi:hypothetical protein